MNLTSWAYIYINILVLIELVTGCVFFFVLSYRDRPIPLWPNFDVPAVIFDGFGPLFYVAICLYNFWTTNNIFNGESNRMRSLAIGIIYRIWTVLGNKNIHKIVFFFSYENLAICKNVANFYVKMSWKSNFNFYFSTFSCNTRARIWMDEFGSLDVTSTIHAHCYCHFVGSFDCTSLDLDLFGYQETRFI